jgi:hypothetical protein
MFSVEVAWYVSPVRVPTMVIAKVAVHPSKTSALQEHSKLIWVSDTVPVQTIPITEPSDTKAGSPVQSVSVKE